MSQGMSFATSAEANRDSRTSRLCRLRRLTRTPVREPAGSSGDGLPLRSPSSSSWSRSASRTSRLRARWHEVEDGVLWGARAEGVTAVEVAPGSAGGARRHRARRRPARRQRRAGSHAGRRRRVPAPARKRARGSPTRWSGSARSRRSRWRWRPRRRGSSMYYVLAAVGLFTLLVGASVRLAGRAIRRRCISSGCASPSSARSRSRSTARSIGSTGCSTGATPWRMALLPPLLLHFTLVFPERPPGDRRLPRRAAAAGDVPAGARARRRTRRRDRARRVPTARCSRARSSCSIAPSRCTCSSASRRGARRARARVPARSRR